jgi:hypothetical protein
MRPRKPPERRQAEVLSPPICLMESSTFWPSRRTPMAASTEMLVAFLSSRVRITVPSRSKPANAIRPREWANRTMSSSARLRAHQASQSTFTLRQARLTTMSHVAPLIRAKMATADGALEQPEQGPLDTACVVSGKADRRDQRLGLLYQPLVTGQRLRPPFP